MEEQDVVKFILVAFPIGFVTIWCFVMFLISIIGGWSTLAKRYRVEEPGLIDWSGWQYGRFGQMDMHGTLWIAASDRGLYLKTGPAFFFRFMHPPLLIPWDKLENVENKSNFHVFFAQSTTFTVDGVRIWLPKDIMDGAKQYLPDKS